MAESLNDFVKEILFFTIKLYICGMTNDHPVNDIYANGT